MKNIHLLPTDKPSRLFDFMTALVLTDNVSPNDSGTNHHIYITSSDEEIKEGDWVISNYGELIKISYKGSKVKENVNEFCKKIILTTDQDLIKDGVQPIEDYFLEWFVKNPSCEYVEIKKGSYNLSPMEEMLEKEYVPKGTFDTYKIIIPQEELK
jgi:hypothetical protein